MLEAALTYAERGWHVLPLNGKRPITANGLRDATTDAATLRRWWADNPDANVGIACESSGLLALDIDVRDGRAGEQTLAALVEKHGDLTPTVEAVTGSGGRHLLFGAPHDLKVPGTIGEHVDLKYHGYFVAPPSLHPDTGVPYSWADGASPDERDLAPAPIEWIKRATQSAPRPEDRFADEGWTVDEGERHAALVSIAGTLRQRLAVSPDEIEQILHVLSPRFGDAPDRRQHIAQVAQSMANYAPGQVPFRYRFPKPDVRTDLARFTLLSLEDAAVIAEEPVDWVVPSLLAAGEKGVIAGPPKSLKTWLALHLLRTVACTGKVLDEAEWEVPDGQAVIFVQEEGSRQRWARRLLMAFDGEVSPPFFYTHRAGFSLLDAAHVEWLIEQARRASARLIVIDPWQRVTPGVKENDATDTGPAWDAVHRIASETGAAVLLLHHSSKGDGPPSMDSIRGSSRMAGEVDLLMVLRKKERGVLEMFLDGRDLVRGDSEDGNLEIAYDGEHPHRMCTTGAKINLKGATNRTRAAVIAALQRATDPLSTTQVLTEVMNDLGATRTRAAVASELQVLADERLVEKDASGKGRPTYWTWCS